jgi:hypothetical protein
MTIFEILYDLALNLKTCGRLAPLSCHRGQSRNAAEAQLQNDILTTVMPGESVTTEWGIVRIFTKNFINRAQAPVKSQEVDRWIEAAENAATGSPGRVAALLEEIAACSRSQPRAREVGAAVNSFTQPDQHFGGTCLEWIQGRRHFWSAQSASALDSDLMLADLAKIYRHQAHAFAGMGLPVTANLFADIGVVAFAKPDLHVVPIISLLALIEPDLDDVFQAIVEIAKLEAPLVAANQRFAWLTAAGGLFPRHLDRLIYLIGSDNHGLAGKQQKSGAKKRRRLMIEALKAGGVICGRFSGVVPQEV